MAVNCEALRNADAGNNPWENKRWNGEEYPVGYTEVREIDGSVHVPWIEHIPQPKKPSKAFVRQTLCGKPMTLDRRHRKPTYGLPTCPECKRLNDLRREDVAAFIEWSRSNRLTPAKQLTGE